MSTGTKKGYEFTVQGKYYAENEHGRSSLKFYKKEKFILPEIVTYVLGSKWEYYTVNNPNGKDKIEKKRSVPNVKRQNALMCFKYVLKNYYLEERLKTKYPDYIRFQTYQVVSRKEVTLDEDMLKAFRLDGDIQEMNESQLIQYVAIKDLSVDLKNYFDVADKKYAVEQALEEATNDRPGIDRPLTQEEQDLLPPEGVMLSTGQVSSEDGVPIDDEDDMAAFQ